MNNRKYLAGIGVAVLATVIAGYSLFREYQGPTRTMGNANLVGIVTETREAPSLAEFDDPRTAQNPDLVAEIETTSGWKVGKSYDIKYTDGKIKTIQSATESPRQ